MAYNQRNSQRDIDRVRYELNERIGVLGIKDNGWTKEVNVVSWNGGIPKEDIREWDSTHERMAKGITMLEEKAENLANRYGIGKLQSNTRQSSSSFRSGGDYASGSLHESDTAESSVYEEADGMVAEEQSASA